MERIDILIATYNGEKYLKEQLESILNQTYKNIRIVIVDDKSTDSTTSIIHEYMKKDNRIVFFENEINIGSNKTFEYLLTKVESDYFMFSDQDDYWKKDKVELSYNKLINDNADLVFTDLEVVDENLNLINKSFNRLKKYDYKIKRCSGYDMLNIYNVITGCTILSKSCYIKDILPFPDSKNILHDYWVGLVVSLKGKATYLDVPTIKYRQHLNNQVGTSRYTDRLKSFNEVREHLINLRIENFNVFLDNKKIFNKAQDEFNRQALEYYNMVKLKRNINFKNLSVFHKLYKHDRVTFYISLFMIMNLPFVVRWLYNVKKTLKNTFNKNHIKDVN